MKGKIKFIQMGFDTRAGTDLDYEPTEKVC